MPINRSFRKQIDVTERKADQTKEGSEVKTFTVPFALGEIKENITITTNTHSKPSKEEIINQAFKYHSQGNIKKAAESYQYFIDLGFRDHRVFSNYGIILRDLDKLNEAELLTRKSIKEKPDFVEGYYNLGIILDRLGKSKESEKAYRKAIKLNPNFVEAYLNLGSILKGFRELKEAKELMQKAIKIKPDLVEAHSNLGTILKDLGRFKEAEYSTHKAIGLNREFVEAHYNLGNIFIDLRKLQEAEKAFRMAIEIKPDFAKAHMNLGLVYIDLGKFKEAEYSTRKAIKFNPDLAEAYSNLAIILQDYEQGKESEKLIRKAIELKPDLASSFYNLGSLLSTNGKLEEAKKAFEKGINLENIEPNKSKYIGNLLHIFSKMADWNSLEKYSIYFNQIGIEGGDTNPLNLMYLEDNPENHLKRAIKFGKQYKRDELETISFRKKSKIKIGYFSSDFNNHPITHLLSRIIELHDKSKFKIYAYSLSNNKDKYTERIKNSVFCFREANTLSDLEIAKIAKDDQLDIALDLNGYTKYNRTSIFSYRVAPIQINYLGYMGSLGFESVDYILADQVLIPQENRKFYSEKILYLPNSYTPPINQENIERKIFKREELGLPSDGFIFTCFNRIEKITRREFTIWINLLKRVERSFLWIVKPHDTAINNILSELCKNGLEKDRVIFAEKMNLSDHLSRYSCGDICLDTFNYNSGITALNALQSGLPIITLLGNSFCARMAASALSRYDLNELITYNEVEYESLAYELATNRVKLNDLGKKIKFKINNSNNDYFKYVKELEDTFINLLDSHICK